MRLGGILPFARQLLGKAVNPGDIAVDATLGNGHDTLFLAGLVGENGHVFGFDIQEAAVESTLNRLTQNEVIDRVTLFHKGHENVYDSIPTSYHGQITGAIFNLGYLPGGDKAIVTHSNTTIAAIEQLIEMLAPEGIIVLVIYHGHPEGAIERDELLQYVEQLNQRKVHVLRYQFINQENHPPFIVAIEKR